MKLLIEATAVGLSLATFVWVIRLTDFKNCNNEFMFMFLVGVLMHLLFEFSGINKWLEGIVFSYFNRVNPL